MQWIAMLTMLIDHIGAVFFPDQQWLRIIGRIAFPLYAYLMVIGYQRTRSYTKYVLRVALLAAISQPMYQWAFDTKHFNIIVTLLVGLILFKLMDAAAKNTIIQCLGVITALFAAEWFSLDYGAYGLALMLIFRYASRERMVLYHGLLELLYLLVWGIQFFSLIVTCFISFLPNWVKKVDQINVPRWLWRSFYPLHLLIIAIISYNI